MSRLTGLRWKRIQMMRLLSAAVLAAFCLATQASPVTHEPDARYAAELMFSAHVERRHYPDILRINPALDEGFLYEVQKRFVEYRLRHGAPIGGYKGGFIPKAPIGGVLFAPGILINPAEVDSTAFQSLLVEAEIAFRMCEPVTAPFAGVDAVQAATCEVYPAIELPDAALPDLAGLRKDFARLRRLLIPTNIAASHLLLGDSREPADLDLNRIDVVVRHDGEEIGRRDGGTSTDDVWARVLWVVNEFVLPNGYAFNPDHVILPGALTGLHQGKPGAYRVDYGPLGHIEFRIR